jgi:radical SAM superfamily enzyme YgiQ (UPF0313 family)
MAAQVQLGSPWIRPGAAVETAGASVKGPVDVLFISPWLEEASVSPTFQIIREELSHASQVVGRRILEKYFSPAEIDNYSDVIRYAKRYPISLGILSIASYLHSVGLRVAYVQMEAERERAGDSATWLNDALARVFTEYQPAVVGVGAVTSEIPRVRQICRLIRALSPRTLIVAGGPHLSFRPGDLLTDDLADIVVHGEGEGPMLDIVHRHAAGQEVDGIPGTSIKRNGRILTSSERVRSLVEHLPQPDYGLLSDEMKTKGIIYAMYTRACPYKCAYCSEGQLFGSRLHSYPVVDFVNTLEYIAATLRWKFIHIADSTFGLPLRSLYALLDELERRGSRFLFSINVRPDLHRYIDGNTLGRMRELGFIEFLIGCESGSDTILKSMRRNHSVSDLLQTLHILKQARIPFVSTYWMVALPGETLATISETASLIKRLMDEDLVYYASAKPFIPLPGTPIFDKPESWGVRILSEDWSLYERYSLPLPHRHANLTQHETEAATLLLQSIQAAAFQRRAGTGLYEDVGTLQRRIERGYERAVYL